MGQNGSKLFHLSVALVLASNCSVKAKEPLPSPAHPEPARTHGWIWKTPPDQVKPDSGKRNNVFYVGEPVQFKLGGAAVSYEVRNYYGDLVDSGPAGTSVTLKVSRPGWYKLYVYGSQTRPEWGDIVGGTTFVIFRNDPHFPAMPSPDTSGGSYGLDEVVRAVTGMGPQRHSVQDAAKPDEAIKSIEADIAIDKAMYLPYDPYRKRSLMIAFPNGTKGKEDGVRQIVAHFKDSVEYWEPRNEPNGGSSGHDFALNEMKPFYEAVKSVDPSLKVIGPGTVSINPGMQAWIEDFLKAGGGDYIDGFSFHVYNNVNGDIWLARKSLSSLNALLAKYGQDKKEKWQTEQGFFAAVYGSYQPRLQGRWTMDELMAFEQFGITKEHNILWYDVSHGFWDVPTWWENDDGGLNPAAALVRVWSEELYGTKFVKAYDFGDPGNKLTIGSLFGGPGKWVAAFQSAGSTDGQVQLRIQHGDVLHLVSAFGEASTLPVQNGAVTLPVPELPVYVELTRGQTIQVVPTDWGPDLARAPGVTANVSLDPSSAAYKTAISESPKLFDGDLQNWYWDQQKSSTPWLLGSGDFPAWVGVDLPAPTAMSRVVVYSAPPWQKQGTLIDYELQYDRAGQWVTLDHVQEPTKTFGVYSPATRTTVDSFFSDRWIFTHSFPTVTTSKIRLLIQDATCGGGATKIVAEAGGQAWGTPDVMLREIEIYGK